MALLGLGTGMMLVNFHTYGILLSLSAALYMFVRYFTNVFEGLYVNVVQ